MSFTLKLTSIKDGFVKNETSKLKTLDGTLNRYREYLEGFAFETGYLFFDYISEFKNPKDSMYYLTIVNNDDGREVYSKPFSAFIKSNFSTLKLKNEVIKYIRFSCKFAREGKNVTEFRHHMDCLARSPIYPEIFGEDGVKELLKLYDSEKI